MTLPPLDFASYEAAPPAAYDGDPIWRTRMFRMATFLSSRCSTDAARLGTRVSLDTAHQFVRAVSSVAANIAEGYSRGGTADRLRFYTYALGSVREALAWMDALGDAPWEPREVYRDLLVQIRRQLLTAIKSMRPTLGEARRGAPKRSPL
ncbi:MAG: four helix bundle protein [Gemmatimonadota bacterium]|nr:four helix bundle protein [Gemmatimonadota bacterium]